MCWPFDKRKSPLAPPFDSAQGMLFQRGVLLWDREELELAVRKSPFFKRGIKGDFQSTSTATLRGRLSNESPGL